MLRPIGAAALVLGLVLSTAADAQLSAVRVASGLDEPLYLAAPAGDDRLFVVERAGTIRIIDGGVVQPTPFLDITSAVRWSEDDEGGLLALAFDPAYATSGVFYVYYTGFSESSPVDMRSVVSRFTVNGDPATATTANAASESMLFELDQPDSNHNGGTIAIRDGWLYLGLGDGGSSGDPNDHAQDDTSFFGKMLRLDLATPSPTNDDWEIWAKGFRNPYRFSFDRVTGDLYIGDVGQATQEEIDVAPANAPAGLNFGWDVLEGTLCFDPDPGEPPCNDPGLVDPVFTFDHPGSIPGIVIGGSVYRGNASGSLRGDYFFADAAFSRIYRMRWTAAGGLAGPVADVTSEIDVDVGSIQMPLAIAEGGDGELYFVGRFGQIHRLVPEPGLALAALAALGSLLALHRRARS